MQVWHPNARTHVRLLGPCFKTGRWEPFRQGLEPHIISKSELRPRSTPRQQRRLSPEGYHTDTNLPQHQSTLTRTQPKCMDDASASGLTLPLCSAPPTDLARAILAPSVFPPNNFKHFLTLFSKFFASFPHGTCSLSVSRQYLALDEIYHPLNAALPSNATRQERIVRSRAHGGTGFSPSPIPCSKGFEPRAQPMALF